MKAGVSLESIAVGIENAAALRDGGVKLGEAGEVLIDEWLVDEGL